MAVIKSLGLEVTIKVNDKALPEYNDPDPDPELQHKHPGSKLIHKYVESEDDLEYTIHYSALPDHRWLPNRKSNVLSFAIVIDGKHQRVGCLTSDYWEKDTGERGTIDGLVTSTSGDAGNLSRFTFSAINTLDRADPRTVKQHLELAKELGTIRIEVDREVLTKVLGLSPATALSRAEMPIMIEAKKLDKHPYAIFNFKYRSRDDLRNEMIVPRTPNPGLSDEVEVEELSEEELRRLARERLAEIRRKKTPVKDEPSRVKRESDGPSQDRPRKRARGGERHEVVDLTDD